MIWHSEWIETNTDDMDKEAIKIAYIGTFSYHELKTNMKECMHVAISVAEQFITKPVMADYRELLSILKRFILQVEDDYNRNKK